MRFEAMEQRGPEWYAARLGLPTASQFDRIITPGGKPASADKVNTYLAELIAEKIFGLDEEKQEKISRQEAVRYGVATEAEAANALERKLQELHGPILLEPGGFMWGEGDRYGCSPDRQVTIGNQTALVEIKCPTIPTQVKHVLYGPGEGYKAQVQGQLMISNYDAVHFYSYRHDCPPCHRIVLRDDAYIRVLHGLLNEFCDRLQKDYERARHMEGWKP